MPVQLTPEMVRRAVVDRDPSSVRSVVQGLTSIIHTRVAFTLLRRRTSAHGRDLRQDTEDLVQEVFEFLLSDGGRRMLSWDPERGSAATFFGLLAERCVLNILASRRRSPWTEDPAEESDLERSGGSSDPPEGRVGSREMLRQLGQRLLEDLNERDQRLFELMYVQQADDQKVREELGIGRDALYQARKRLLERVRRLAAQIGPEFESWAGAGS
jgi:RNA polymerase sigma factor (sigma-70 family)